MEGCDGNSNPLGVRLLQFTHLGGLLHTEVNFVGVLSNNLELDVFSIISGSSSLLLIHLDDVVLFHLQSFGCLVIIDSSSVKEKSEGCDGNSNPLGVGLLQFTHLGGLFHSEVDLVGVLAYNLQFDVLGVIRSSSGLLLVNLNDIILFHLQSLGCLVIVDSSSVEEESEGSDWDTNPLGVGLFQLTHLGGLLHPEVDLVRVLSDHLELDVFRIISRHLEFYFFVAWRSNSQSFSVSRLQ